MRPYSVVLAGEIEYGKRTIMEYHWKSLLIRLPKALPGALIALGKQKQNS